MGVYCILDGAGLSRGCIAFRTVQDSASEPRLLALDCEMCLSSESAHELVRVALVDAEGKVVYDRLVKPEAEVLDYREGVTGISAATLKVCPR